MDRTKTFVHNLGEYIADYMGEHGHSLDRKIVHDLAELCEDFTQICDFVCKFADHHDGSLYALDGTTHAHDHMLSGRMATEQDSADMMANPRRRT